MAEATVAVAVRVLGTVSVLFWSALFLPQLYENYARSSTVGLSQAMCFIWCLSGSACAAYLIYYDENVSLIIQFSLMSFGSLLTMGQIFLYDTFARDLKGRLPYLSAFVATLLLLLFFVGFGAGLLFLFVAAASDTVALLLGSVLPAVGFAAGFFPQIYEIVRTESGRGYSTGLSLLDSTGCVTATVALLLDGGDPVGLVSYVVIFSLQYVMLLLKWRYPGPPKIPGGTTAAAGEENLQKSRKHGGDVEEDQRL